jgi:fructan beta-fructosidase
MKIIYPLSFMMASFFYGAGTSHSVDRSASAETDSNVVSYRPLYHFSPDSNWINDPNGLVYANGKFHLFMQYNPFGCKWGHMSWGHAESKDLFSWNELPVALPETTNADSVTSMIFSGSAVVDSFNTTGFATKKGEMPLVAIYTANIFNKTGQLVQNQNLAYSVDEGNTWKQYAENPVLDIHLKDFRDPKVFWYGPKKKWIMAAVKSVEYKVQFYESADLKSWKLLSEFGGMGNMANVWECPDMYELPVEGSKQKKWVLSLSAGHPQKGFLGMQYFIGDFDGEKFTPDALPYPLYVDHGKDYYAGVTYNDIPAADGRTIMIGWANCWNYANNIPTSGYRGMYAVPRSLSLKRTANGLRLFEQPVEELKKHEQNIYKNAALTVDNGTNTPGGIRGGSLDISFTLEAGEGTAGINVFKSGTEETSVYYDSKTKTVSVDRTKSGDTSFNAGFSSIESVELHPAGEKVKFRILIDKSIVEVFANNGEHVITDLVFPTSNEDGVEFFSRNGKAVFSDIVVNRVNKSVH